MPARLRLGVAEVDITPPMPVPLAGFAKRVGPFEDVARPLFARVFFFSQDDPGHGRRQALLVSADLIWWGPDRVPALRRRIRERWGVPEDAVILHGTHTHSGPQTSDRFLPSLGPPDADYLAFLESRVFAAIERARADQEPVTVERGEGECRIGVNRRGAVGGGIELTPNPTGPTDPEMAVVRFRTRSGATTAVLMHYACHPTTTMERRISSEFPGVAVERVKEALGEDVAVAYLQGCCGDINPGMVRGGGVRYGTDEDVRRLGWQLADAVLTVLDAPMGGLTACSLRSQRLDVDVPFQRVPTVAELEAQRHEPGVVGEWSELLLRDRQRLRSSIPLELTRLDLADGLSLLAMNAEVTVPYGFFVEERCGGRVLPLPYSNGMIGYVITAEQLAEGGYEPVGSTPYFGLPSPFSAEIEERVKNGIMQIMADQHADRPRERA